MLNAPKPTYFKDLKADFLRLAAHLDKQLEPTTTLSVVKPSDKLTKLIDGFSDFKTVSKTDTPELVKWFESVFTDVNEDDKKETDRYEKLSNFIKINSQSEEVIKILAARKPVFVLFNNYFKVKPLIHLEHLADRIDSNIMDDDKFYDYGNLCLLKMLGFSPRELSNIGKKASPGRDDPDALKIYRDTLDKRSYQLDAASIRLTKEIKHIWNPNPNRPEAEKLNITAMGNT